MIFPFENKQIYQKIYRCSTSAHLFLLSSRTMSWKKFCAIWREQLEVHNSLSVEMKSATLVCGQFPFLAPWQDEASGDTFVNALPLFALEVDSHGCLLPSCPHVSYTLLFPPPLPLPTSLFLHSSRHGADRHSSSAGTLAQVDQVSHLPGDCAACAFLWLSAAQLEAFSTTLVCCHVR